MMARVFFLTAVSVLFAAAASMAMVPEDILTLQSADPVDLSPDGKFLLYTLSRPDPVLGRATTLLRRDLDTGQELVIFTPADRGRGCRWRPDGKAIAYLKTTDAGTEAWLMDADGGQRRALSPVAGTFGDLHWAPDGSALAWVAGAAVGEYAGEPGLRVVADGLGYRHLGDGYRAGQRGQLFVMDLANGDPRRLVDGPLDVREVSWSPDSRELVFSAKAEADLGWTLNTELYVVHRQGGDLRRLTENPGQDSQPRWLDDGRIAWLRTTEPLWESQPRLVAEMDPAVGAITLHGENFDDFVMGWAEFRGGFYVLGANRGCIDLFRVDGGRREQITRTGRDLWSVKMAGHRAVFSGASQTNPGAILMVDLAEKVKGPHQLHTVVDPNLKWPARDNLTEPEPFTVMVDGREISGWFFKPADLEPGQTVPLVLSLHGGPEWMYGGYFLPEFHILPRFGYGVVIANPTGSMGYGTEFMSGVRHDWVDRPAREVMACVDLAIEQGWADPDRLAVMGGSYGGHLGAALTTQTDRFRAAALDRMYPETITFWGTTDEKWFAEWEFGGKPWDPGAREIYLRNSPWEKVDRVTTPTLISQGHRDFRCLAAGGQMWFSALQSRGVPSRFIRFETEGHGIRDPRNRVFYQHELLKWFDTYVLEHTHE